MNEPVDPQYFVGENFGKPWKVERIPGGSTAADPGPATTRIFDVSSSHSSID